MAILRQISMAPAAASANNVAQSQSPGAGAIVLNGSTVSGGVATLDIPRRVILTSGGNDTGITFTVIGTSRSGATQSETVTGASGAAAVTTQDFKTITSVTHTGSVATTVTVGTTGTTTSASSEWVATDTTRDPVNFGLAVVVTGTINYSVEYTYDDPNAPFSGTFPTVFTISGGALTAKAANADAGSTFNFPVTALRVTINTYTTGATIKMLYLQVGT